MACRQDFANIPRLRDQDFSVVVESSIDTFVTDAHFIIPEGIALNLALKENLFATVACVISGVPVGIFGAPGSSKTLSFQIIRDNMKGKNSQKEFCRLFPALDCFFYQCSEYTTSQEITNIFDRAILRQSQFDKSQTRVVVFMDEASLPVEDRSRMALKALHAYLDEPKVSFICISKFVATASIVTFCVRAINIRIYVPYISQVGEVYS